MECLEKATIEYDCHIHAFVLMTNHYHLLVSTPQSNLDQIMQFIQREIARRANKKSLRINHFFGGPYKWSIVKEENYYWNVLKYIFRNPIKAGICSTVSEYKFSSLNMKPQNFDWLVTDFFNDRDKKVCLDHDWLNEPYLKETEECIRAALKHKEFKISRGQNGYLPSLDTPLSKKGGRT